MSIHDIRRLKRTSLQPKPAILDGFIEFPKEAMAKIAEKKTVPRLKLDALHEPNQKSGKGCAEVRTTRCTRKNGSEGLYARYNVFVQQPVELNLQKGRNQAVSPQKQSELGRSCVVSSLMTRKDPKEESSECPIGDKNELITPRPCFSNCKPTKNAFFMELVVGKGGFGKVWRVKHRKSGNTFAMKQLEKYTIISRKSVSSILNELQLLTRLRNPFLINAHYAFQDRSTLFLVLDYVNGGDLRYHITKQKKFPEEQTRFFVCCILLGLEYLHSQKVIHRDLKPENLVFSERGYLRITDLGISREWSRGNGEDTSGTPGYMSPEVITHRQHSYECDFFALGVIVHELILGRRPYTGRSRQEIREQMLLKQARIESILPNWTAEAIDFTNRLLERRPHQRLGSRGGCQEVQNHPWLRNFDWKGLKSMRLTAPYLPVPIQNDYANYRDANISSSMSSSSTLDLETALMLKSSAVQDLFTGYYFNIDQSRIHVNRSQSELSRRQVRSISRRA